MPQQLAMNSEKNPSGDKAVQSMLDGVSFIDTSADNLSKTSKTSDVQESILIAGKPQEGDLPPLQESTNYRIGHRTPPPGQKLVITGPALDAATTWTNVTGEAAKLGGFEHRQVNNLHQLINEIIAQSVEFGPVADVVIRGHGEPGAFAVGKNEYSLNNRDVINEFGRLTKAHALAKGAQIEFQGCNIAVGADDPNSPTLPGLQAIADITHAHVLGSPNLQAANRFGWTGQVIDVPPKSN